MQAVAQLTDADKSLLQRAWGNLPIQKQGTCAFTQTVMRPEDYDSDVVVKEVSRFDPDFGTPDPWKLVSVDDRDPEPAEQEEFRPYRQTRLLDMLYDQLRVEEAKFIAQEDDIRIFEMPVNATKSVPKGMAKNLIGTVRVHVPTETVEIASLGVKKPFRMRVIVKVNRYDQTLRYERDPNAGGLVLRDIEMNVQMRALTKKVNIKMNARYSDFVCPPEQVTAHLQT